jgi:molybdopterin-binding protein
MDEAIRIGAVATALGVSADTLRRWERQGRVTFERRGGDRWLPIAELKRLLRERQAPLHTSARNRLAGVVVDVAVDGLVAQIELACGPFRIVSLVTREAVEELGLKPGDPATAVVKSTTVIVESGN